MARLVCGAAALFHFVLVHGAGGGAYFWFKFANLLLESGYDVTALDLKAAGADGTDHVNVKSFQYYNTPLLQLLSQLPPEKKVVLIAHSWGGQNVAHAMELDPDKIQLAVFVAAPLRPTSADATPTGDGIEYVYGNGPREPATGLLYKIEVTRQSTYQLTSNEDFLLAIYMRKPIPFAVYKTNFTVSAQNYGSVPLVYVKALEDLVIQNKDMDMIASHPFGNLKEVLTLHSDHVVPLSHPSEFYKLFTEIVSTYLCSGNSRASN